MAGVTQPLPAVANPTLQLHLQSTQASVISASVEDTQHATLIHFQTSDLRPSASFHFPALDLSTATGLEVLLSNPGTSAVRVYGMLNQNAWVSDYVLLHAGETASLRIFLQRHTFQPACMNASYQKMNGLPDGQMKLWQDAEVDAAAVQSLTLYTIGLSQNTTVRVERVAPFSITHANASLCGTRPFVDRYGQNSFAEWPGKVHADEQLRHSIATEEEDIRTHAAPAGFDRFGGWSNGPHLAAAKHFRVVKYHGRWWFVDPDGHLFWSNGITTVLYNEPTEVAGRAGYFQDPAPNGDFLARNLATKYGADLGSVVRNKTIARMRSWGVNTIGPWSDEALTNTHKATWAEFLSSRTDDGKIDPYSDAWKNHLRQQLLEKARTLNNDPWCLGIFIDNEIHDSQDANWWKAYYQTVQSLVHETLPGLLYLGSRLDFANFPQVDAAKIAIVRIAAQYTDVISMNQYRYTLEDFKLPEGVDRPVLIGEFHFGALDRGPLHTGLRSVKDQTQRAEAYKHYVESALLHPNMVGVHWFQMYDEPVTGRGDGENYQIGFLDICDQPYTETIAASRQLAASLYRFRANATSHSH